MHLCALDDPQRTARVSSSSSKWEVNEVEWNPHYAQRTYVASAVCALLS